MEINTFFQGGKKPSLDTLFFRKTLKRHIKDFACLMSIFALLIACYLTYKYFLLSYVVAMVVVSAVLLTLGYKAPSVLYPVWKSWMLLAHNLGIVVSFIVVSLAWIIMVVPLALVLRAVGKKVMDMSYKTDVDSYYEDRSAEQNDFKLLERQY